MKTYPLLSLVPLLCCGMPSRGALLRREKAIAPAAEPAYAETSTEGLAFSTGFVQAAKSCVPGAEHRDEITIKT